MTASRGKLLHHVIVPVALLVAVSMAVVVGFYLVQRTQTGRGSPQAIDRDRARRDRA